MSTPDHAARGPVRAAPAHRRILAGLEPGLGEDPAVR